MSEPLTRVCVLGGGHLGHALAGILAASGEMEVSVLTRRPERWSTRLRVLFRDELEMEGPLFKVSNDPAQVLPGRGLVLVTVPMHARAEVLGSVRPYLSPGAWVGGVPGGGGFDWVARRSLGAEVTIFGVQRTPYIARTILYGSIAGITGVSNRLHLAAVPRSQAGQIGETIEHLFGIPVTVCDNYLCVTLAPANAIYHPSRLLTLFHHWRPGVTYERQYRLYAEWDDAATELYCACDREIQKVCEALPLDMRTVMPILEYYGVRTAAEMTARIQSLEALANIPAPMAHCGAGYVPDFESRFFREDIPWGAVVIRGVAEVVGVRTPAIDGMIGRAQELLGEEYLVAGQLAGRDTRSLPIPRLMGLNTIERLVRESS